MTYDILHVIEVHSRVSKTVGPGGYCPKETYRVQWWIQDFPEKGVAASKGGCTSLLFCQIFAENCMKMKEFGLRWGRMSPILCLRLPTYMFPSGFPVSPCPMFPVPLCVPFKFVINGSILKLTSNSDFSLCQHLREAIKVLQMCCKVKTYL